MAMRIGIVGLPNAGKSTLFNALTAGGAETGDYPFTTVEPNTAISPVADDRLAQIYETLGSSEMIPETIEFKDIAGLVKGAAEGEGLGNQFLAAIRETDAICHVVRCHGDTGVPHPDGSVDPVRDAETIDAELLLADLETAERRLTKVTKEAKGLDKPAVAERDWLEQVRDALAGGRPARSVPVPQAAADAPRQLAALTSKPVLYVANVTEGEVEVPEALADHAAANDAGTVAISARIESDLAELEGTEAAEMRSELGIAETGLVRLVHAAYELLDLITFFTADKDKEATARSLPRGGTAHEAAAKVHTEIADAFVRAEIIGWHDLVEAGGYVAAADRGLIRTEGRDYVVADGDVVHIKT
jgi:GTP-binding protein YchF